jgi:hypothetical protein
MVFLVSAGLLAVIASYQLIVRFQRRSEVSVIGSITSCGFAVVSAAMATTSRRVDGRRARLALGTYATRKEAERQSGMRYKAGIAALTSILIVSM